MIFLYIIIAILVFLTILLLFPIIVKIDSIRGIYRLEWKHIFSADFLFINEEPIARLKFFFLKKDFELLKIKSKKKNASKPKKKKSPKEKISTQNLIKKFKKVIKTIEVKQFYFNIDTNDYIWNAYLYPIFFFLKKENKAVHINYQGDVELLLNIQARPIQVLFAFIF